MDTPNFETVLHQAANNGVYHLPAAGREAMQDAVEAAEMVFRLVNLDDGEELDEVFAGLAEGLGLPEHFGANFDALYDCLTDLSWQDTSSTVIVLTGCDALHAVNPEAWQTLIDVFRSAADYWRDEEVPFWVFIDMRADGLASLPTLV